MNPLPSIDYAVGLANWVRLSTEERLTLKAKLKLAKAYYLTPWKLVNRADQIKLAAYFHKQNHIKNSHQNKK